MLSFLYVYSDHSILECYNLFSGVELSMRSFFVIIAYVVIRGCAIISGTFLFAPRFLVLFGLFPDFGVLFFDYSRIFRYHFFGKILFL